MLGNRVELSLCNPLEEVYGELRKQGSEGVWIYHGFSEQAAVHFYPQHRIVSIKDRGPVYR